jgi:hypothetical protein
MGNVLYYKLLGLLSSIPSAFKSQVGEPLCNGKIEEVEVSGDPTISGVLQSAAGETRLAPT